MLQIEHHYHSSNADELTYTTICRHYLFYNTTSVINGLFCTTIILRKCGTVNIFNRSGVY